jgi:hypothetical protein
VPFVDVLAIDQRQSLVAESRIVCICHQPHSPNGRSRCSGQGAPVVDFLADVGEQGQPISVYADPDVAIHVAIVNAAHEKTGIE